MANHRTFSGRFSPAALVLSALACLLVACAGVPAAGGGPYVWIDVPPDGMRVPVNQAVHIEGHAAYSGGIARIEIWVGGDLHLIQDNLPVEGGLAHFDQMWMPPGAGDYTVQVIAIGADGATSQPDQVRLYVGEAVAEVTPPPEEIVEPPTATPPTTPTATLTLTPTATQRPPSPTATPTPMPGHVVQFWADANQVEAGTCIKLHWHVENVKAVFLDGNGVVGDGSKEICPCEEKTYTLTVELADGSQEKHALTIRVTGTCATLTPKPTNPPPDQTPPPAPALVSPSDGETLACTAKVTLDWDAVTDPSGIAEYRVRVERHAGDNNWQPVSGSPWTGLSGTELEIDVECGWTYRWRVRAVDGAGNMGPFSGWFEFVLPMT